MNLLNMLNYIDKCSVENRVDDDGNPAGGFVKGTGLDIYWQEGPLGHGEGKREPNGAFVETVLAAIVKRIEFYQEHFPCRENAIALTHIETALLWLDKRTKDREARGVEGLHKA
jgi:hypothetical protein